MGNLHYAAPLRADEFWAQALFGVSGTREVQARRIRRNVSLIVWIGDETNPGVARFLVNNRTGQIARRS